MIETSQASPDHGNRRYVVRDDDRDKEFEGNNYHREGEEGKLPGNALALPHLHALEYVESVCQEQSVGEETYVVL